jgi:hypothetical protein
MLTRRKMPNPLPRNCPWPVARRNPRRCQREFGQVVQPGSPCQSVITTPGGDWRLSAARTQIAALKAGELTKSIQVVNVSFPLAEG